MKTLLVSIKIFLVLTVLTGIIYPLFITGIAQVVFPGKANGSLIVIDNRTIGSKLIGQDFDTTIFFSSRPSYVSYNPLSSGGSNYGLINKRLKDLVAARKHDFCAYNQLDSATKVPSEILFASASGLDPHISRQAALLQADRVAKSRNFSKIQKQKLLDCINELTERPQFSFLGEERINVLLLNLETERIP